MKLKDINILDLYHSWQHNTNYFECYLRTSPFASLKHYSNFQIYEEHSQIEPTFSEIKEILNKFDLSKSLFFIDLPDVITITTAYLLNNLLSIKPILSFNFMVNDYGQVGSKDFVNALVFCGNNLERITPVGYAFILDYNRFSDFQSIDTSNTFNNQYEINDESVPDITMLKQLGYSDIVYISQSDAKEDIKNYLDYLSNENLKVSKFTLKGAING